MLYFQQKGVCMKKLLFLIFLISLFFLHGCASRLELTDNQKTILATLTEADAETIIVKTFKNTESQSGLFASNGSPFISNPQIKQIENGLVVYADFEEYVSDVSVTRKNDDTVWVEVKWDHTIETFELDLIKVKKIRFVNRSLFRDGIIKSVNGTQFGLLGDNGVFVNVDVVSEYADELIAAVRFYNPSVTIMSGIGL